MTILLNIELSYQLDDNTICPKQCICSSKRMNCELSGLNYLPIPPPILQLEYLLIQNQTFMNTELGPNELSIYRSIEYGGQIQLKSLHIRYCNIISLKRNTFQILGKQLRLLDLTGNPLIHIEDYTFNGLDQLTLIMDEIKLRNFQLNTFNGLTHMKSLIIRNSNLDELPYQSLIQLITMSKLNQLIINGNQLKQLDKKYDVIFKELQHFEIHDNPWHCDCQLNWLIKRYQSIHKSHRNNTIESNNNNNNNNNNKWNHNDEEDDNQPKCSTPFSLAGYKFNDLITDLSEVYDYNNPVINTWEKSNSPFILYCTPPQLERLDVDLTHLYHIENSMIKNSDHQQYPSVRLTCSMKGSRELSIIWYYHNHNNNTMTLVNLSNHHITHRYPNNKQISYTNNDIIKVESQLDIIKQQQIDNTLPVNIRQQTIQTELGRCIQPTSNSTIGDGSLNSMSYEPISYSDTNNVTYDVPWIVNTNTNDHNINHHKLMNMNQRITNEQCIPLLYNGLPTNLSNPIESNSNNLIHNGLFIPPPPSIPQPSLPNSCTNSTLSLKTVTIQPNIQSNLLFLQSGCYPQLMNSVTTNSQFNQGSIGLKNYLNYHS
ncbi:unnamed protein product [Schistosoma curassoni]|uniref:LRRCT domain-containing protein n=1 Tax=Schistosoma curassoni TaxID=6186 RepID=A0A183K376_9TREM|nr:unnamed protein product [Schistosoma curassoni]